MRRAEMLQEIRRMRFLEVFTRWTERRLTQEQAAEILGVSDRSFRRYMVRYDEEGEAGLQDKRLTQASYRRAPVDEFLGIARQYESYRGWSVRHFYGKYQEAQGRRSYTWVKNTLQRQGMVSKVTKRGVHRKRREKAPLPGMMLHQDGSRHEWVPGKRWDLIVTMDDATNEHYAMFFVEEEGTASSLRGVREVIVQKGLFSSLYTDRGSHYWLTPEEGGKVSKTQLTQFGRAMKQLGIQMIAAYSPQARGRSERAFQTHQDRLVKELALHGITDMDEANRYLVQVYMPAFNAQFKKPAIEEGSAFVPWIGGSIDDTLCEHFERTVNADNCVSFERMTLQIPANRYRCHYVRVKVQVHRYLDGSLAIFHGPRKLADYDPRGKLKEESKAA
jgi:hypothetical protein